MTGVQTCALPISVRMGITIIKFCGITSLADAIESIEEGADMLGFNFYPPSPRSIFPEECKNITNYVSKHFPKTILVGVFVNMSTLNVSKIIQDCGLHLAQLHGNESAKNLAELKGKAFKAFRGVPHENEFKEYIEKTQNKLPKCLIDASVQGIFGGSGVIADWSEAAKIAIKYPILLAGGLNAENVAEAVSQVHPWGVDTASGIEITPGKKDKSKMRAFVNAVRSLEKI